MVSNMLILVQIFAHVLHYGFGFWIFAFCCVWFGVVALSLNLEWVERLGVGVGLDGVNYGYVVEEWEGKE